MDSPLGSDTPENVDGGDLDGGEPDAPLMDVPDGSDGGTPDDAPAITDAGSDAGSDGGVDAGPSDAGRDAGSDAGGPCSGLPMMTFYRDLDGDGHGAAASGTMMRCSPGGGFVVSNDDCDDTNVGRYPGNTELCNNVDDDCNGTVDGAAAAASCGLTNATSACVGGFCEVVSCSSASFGNCDSVDTNGCEADLTSTAANCGGCGVAFRCDRGLSCMAGTCESSPVVQVATGQNLACARRANGRVVCWGALSQWFAGHSASPPGFLEIAGVSDAVDLDVGSSVACVVHATGGVTCWGSNRYGALGRGSTTPGLEGPGPVMGVSDAVEVSTSDAPDTTNPVCVRRSGGGVICWGANDLGQMGDPSNTAVAIGTPVVVGGAGPAASIDVGRAAVCVRRTDNTAYCWGRAGSTTLATPTRRGTLTGVLDIQGDGMCVLTSGGGVDCVYHESGAGPYSTTVPGAVDFERAAGPATASFCYSTTTGIQCHHRNLEGQLGRGFTSATEPTLGAVSGIGAHSSLEGGLATYCAIRAGAVVCWGRCEGGECGDFASGGLPRTTPFVVPL